MLQASRAGLGRAPRAGRSARGAPCPADRAAACGWVTWMRPMRTPSCTTPATATRVDASWPSRRYCTAMVSSGCARTRLTRARKSGTGSPLMLRISSPGLQSGARRRSVGTDRAEHGWNRQLLESQAQAAQARGRIGHGTALGGVGKLKLRQRAPGRSRPAASASAARAASRRPAARARPRAGCRPAVIVHGDDLIARAHAGARRG